MAGDKIIEVLLLVECLPASCPARGIESQSPCRTIWQAVVVVFMEEGRKKETGGTMVDAVMVVRVRVNMTCRKKKKK